MKKYKVFMLLCMLSVAKSEIDFETECKHDYRNMGNVQINVTRFCSTNVCIEKCCAEGYMIAPKGQCKNINAMFKQFTRVTHRLSEVNYSSISLFSYDGINEKKSKKDFVFIQNRRNPNCTSEQRTLNEFYILEDGSVRMQDTGVSNSWSVIKRLEYCVDYKLAVIEGKIYIRLQLKEYNAPPADDYKKSMFVLVGLLISSFFLSLVLVVYCLLPKLQNLIGLVLMSYTASILVTFLVKIVIQLTNKSLTKGHCKVISPMLYFAAVSSFFWLNVMSFDVWWSLRGHRKRCEINRRGERVKFMWYCLYAWGTPLLMTAAVTTLDNIDLSKLPFIKPPFDDCFVYVRSVQLYFITPIGVIIFVNIILFLLTVYNIWMIKRAVNRSQDSRSSTQDTNRFGTYIKLSVLMGVSWCLELIPPETDLWLFILATTYNLLIGVAIFFLFVFNKRILLKLCKRFNINNDLTRRYEVSQGSRSGTTKTTRVNSTKEQGQEMDLLKNCPKGEKYNDC